MNVPVQWVAREPPLAVAGAWAEGAAARQLVARLIADLHGADADPPTEAARRVGRLRGVGGGGFVVVFGAADDLPWVPGVTWLGVDPDGPGLYHPTRVAPDRPIDLVARAIVARAGGPAAVVDGRLVPLAAARPLSRRALEAWAARGA